MSGVNPLSNPGPVNPGPLNQSALNQSPLNPNFVSAIRGPIIMITVGVLFLLDKFTPMQFGETWPVILIIVGVLALAGGRSQRANRSMPVGGAADISGNVAGGAAVNGPPPGVRR